MGVYLAINHPTVAFRDCRDCLLYQYDEGTGQRVTNRDGTPKKRIVRPPCEYKIDTRTGETKCPKGTPESNSSLTEQNMKAWIHYQECRAVGSFPDDPIVRQNARIIRSVEDQVEQAHKDQTLKMLELLARR